MGRKIRHCFYCGAVFGSTSSSRYCSKVCREAWRVDRAARELAKARDEAGAGQPKSVLSEGMQRYVAGFEAELRRPLGIDVTMEIARSIGLRVPGE